MKPAELFIASLHGTKPWPPLNNYSLFVFGSGYNKKRFYQNVYKAQPEYGVLNIRQDGDSQTFISENALRQYSVETFSNYLLDTDSIIKIEDNFYKNFPLVDNIYDEYTYAHIEEKSEEELLPIVGRAFDLIWSSNAWSHFSLNFDLDVCLEVLHKAKPEIPVKDIENIWHIATSSIEESFDKAQKRDFLVYLEKYGPTDQLIEHCQYFFASYRKVYSLNEVRENITKTYKQFFDKPSMAGNELKMMDAEDAEKKSGFAEWKDELSKDQKRIAEYCQIVMRIRDQRKNFFAKGFVVAWRIAEKVFGKAGVDLELIENALPFEELSQGSEYILSIKDELEKRAKKYVAYIPYDGEAIISYEDIEENKSLINSFFLEEAEKEKKEISGKIGNKGMAQGRVRIVRSTEDFASFQEGEILVTGMTRPEFVPLMRLAKAIITDEGGITCHAAIVSRELNKPCVIGTKFATHILQDGDVVEVNAEQGIITIINKSNN